MAKYALGGSWCRLTNDEGPTGKLETYLLAEWVRLSEWHRLRKALQRPWANTTSYTIISTRLLPKISPLSKVFKRTAISPACALWLSQPRWYIVIQRKPSSWFWGIHTQQQATAATLSEQCIIRRNYTGYFYTYCVKNVSKRSAKFAAIQQR